MNIPLLLLDTTGIPLCFNIVRGPFYWQIYTEAESNASLLAIAEAPPDMWRSQIYAEAESRANKFALPRRHSISGHLWPNIAEAESFPEAPPDMWRSQISQKPRAFPRRHRICGEAKYRRSRELSRGATYVAKPNITVPWNRSMKDMKEKSRRDRDRRKRDPPNRGCRGLG